MKMIVEGVMNGSLPWTLVFIGVFIAVVIEVLGIPVLPVAIGLYLPLKLSVPIMAGGVIRQMRFRRTKDTDGEAGSGILFLLRADCRRGACRNRTCHTGGRGYVRCD